jgi:hypothetical protein
MNVLGYKYKTEADAQRARKACSDHYGIPVSPDDVTQFYVNYQTAMFDSPKFWYIAYHESLRVVLGEPTEFQVSEPPEPIETDATD